MDVFLNKNTGGYNIHFLFPVRFWGKDLFVSIEKLDTLIFSMDPPERSVSKLARCEKGVLFVPEVVSRFILSTDFTVSIKELTPKQIKDIEITDREIILYL